MLVSINMWGIKKIWQKCEIGIMIVANLDRERD